MTQRTTRQRHLRPGVFLQPAEELRADLVAGGKQEQVEEDDLHERVDIDVELADDDAGEERADDVAQAERAEPNPPDHEPHSQREEDRQFGILAKRGHQSGQGRLLIV